MGASNERPRLRRNGERIGVVPGSEDSVSGVPWGRVSVSCQEVETRRQAELQDRAADGRHSVGFWGVPCSQPHFIESYGIM